MRNKNLDAREIDQQQHETLAAEHRGMAALDPLLQPDLVDKQITQADASTTASLHLPHERDQSTAMTTEARAPIVKQAFKDEERGLKDTSKEPEMLDAYKKQT